MALSKIISNLKTFQFQPRQSQQQVPQQPNQNKNKNQVSSVKLLEQYFSQNSLGELNFKTAYMEVKSGTGNKQNKGSKEKKMTRYVSTVKVANQSFQTFPNSFNTKEQAEEAAASLAISKLNISSSNNNSVMSMPIGHFEDIENLVDQIFELVGIRSNGVWSTQIDVEYKRKYNKSLPEKWPMMIGPSKEASKKLRVDNPIGGRYIIYPILVETEQIENSSAPVQDSSPTTKTEISTQKRPPKLVLPEDMQNWDVYITCVHSTINVCIRILGDQFSTLFDDMVTNMELKYFETDQVPLDKSLFVSSAQVGKLYAAKVEGNFHFK